ncbi:MAG: hypothetical protein ACREF4_11055 [Gammaproteobacteria bacterium]
MRTVKTLKPGQPGTKALVGRYGASLLCVRSRYDQTTRERLKTVELIVESRSRRRTTVPSAVRRVSLRIDWRETALRQQLKAAGGRWDPAARVWVMRRDHAERLGLLGRVVGRGDG